MKILLYILCLYSSISYAQEEVKNIAVEKKVTLDPKILYEEESRGIDSLFKNMVVVQKKPVERYKNIIFDSHLLLDYSDTPKSMHALVLGVGYGVSENLELGFSFSPFFISTERESSVATKKLILQNGNQAELVSPDPKYEYGLHMNWIFSYGKDARGPFSVLRSDTFFKAFYNKIQFADSLSGSRFGLSVGKTFFISKNFNFRIAVGIGKLNSFVNDESFSSTMATIEPGLVFFY